MTFHMSSRLKPAVGDSRTGLRVSPETSSIQCRQLTSIFSSSSCTTGMTRPAWACCRSWIWGCCSRWGRSAVWSNSRRCSTRLVWQQPTAQAARQLRDHRGGSRLNAGPRLKTLRRQHFAARLGSQRNDEKSDHESDRRQRDGQTQRMCVQHGRGEQEVHASADKAAERGAECERRCAYACLELLRQPEAEERKVAAEESEQEQPGDERRKPIRQIERPAEAAGNTHRHSRKINRERLSASDSLCDQRQDQTAQYGADRQQAGGPGCGSGGVDLAHTRFLRQLNDGGRFVNRARPQAQDRNRDKRAS